MLGGLGRKAGGRASACGAVLLVLAGRAANAPGTMTRESLTQSTRHETRCPHTRGLWLPPLDSATPYPPLAALPPSRPALHPSPASTPQRLMRLAARAFYSGPCPPPGRDLEPFSNKSKIAKVCVCTRVCVCGFLAYSVLHRLRYGGCNRSLHTPAPFSSPPSLPRHPHPPTPLTPPPPHPPSPPDHPNPPLHPRTPLPPCPCPT